MTERRPTLYDITFPLRKEIARLEVDYLNDLLARHDNLLAASKEAGWGYGNFHRLVKRHRAQGDGARWLSKHGTMSLMFVRIPGMEFKIGGRPITEQERRREKLHESKQLKILLSKAAEFIEKAHVPGCARNCSCKVRSHDHARCTCETKGALINELRNPHL